MKRANDAGRGDWRARTLSRVRALIKEAEPEALEEVKWRKPSNPAGVPVWSHEGMICTGETYKGVVKLTFAQGAQLEDPKRLFNSGLAGGTRRAIDLREGDALDETAFKALIREAVALNELSGPRRGRPDSSPSPRETSVPPSSRRRPARRLR